MLIYVWAQDEAGAIGKDGILPWHLPADLKHFKEVTMGHAMLMGKKTFDSFPGLLPGRKHVVLTHHEIANPKVEVLHGEADLKKWLKDHEAEEVCVIGGASLFELLKDRVDCLEVTKIKGTFPADTYMPNLNWDAFSLDKEEKHQADAKNKYDYVFQRWLRKK